MKNEDVLWIDELPQINIEEDIFIKIRSYEISYSEYIYDENYNIKEIRHYIKEN